MTENVEIKNEEIVVVTESNSNIVDNIDSSRLANIEKSKFIDEAIIEYNKNKNA
jgi:hypothetical protein